MEKPELGPVSGLCCNNPPSRGMPHAIRECIPGIVTRQDIPFPKQDELAKIEKEVISTIPIPSHRMQIDESAFVEGDQNDSVDTPVCDEKPKPPLRGSWRCNYHVATVASLTLQQASKLLHLDPIIKRDELLAYEDRYLSCWWHYQKPTLLEVDISYPMSMSVRLRIPSYTEHVTFPAGCCGREKQEERLDLEFNEGYYLWMIAQEYKRIYSEWKKYGVWGHAITDLYFERVTVQDGMSEIGIGS